MWGEVENPMVLHRHTEPKTVGECTGCREDVLEYEEHLMTVDGEIIHDDDSCLANYTRRTLE